MPPERNVSDEWIVSVYELQIVLAAARKEQEPKIRLLHGTFKRLEEDNECIPLPPAN